MVKVARYFGRSQERCPSHLTLHEMESPPSN